VRIAPESLGLVEPIEASVQRALVEFMELPEPLGWRRLAERSAAVAYSCLGDRTRWWFSSAVKARDGRVGVATPKPKHEAALLKIIGAAKRRKPGKVLLLTHDVDYKKGYRAVPWMARLEQQWGFRATYNFLTDAGYTLDRSLLTELVEMGHEVGLHGRRYDLRLAYRSKSSIYLALSKAKNKLESALGAPVLGFRNHSLRLSHRMVEVVAGLGFMYQSGVYRLPERDDVFAGQFWYPFRYEGSNLWEFPVLYPQDTELFRSMGASDGIALNIMLARAGHAWRTRGVVCINHHPSIQAEHREYYRALLEAFAGQNLTSVRCGELADSFRAGH